MKISLKWLNDFLDVSEYFNAPEKLAEKLTSAGIEVEGIENLAVRFKNVVVGQIEKLERHPNADRLTVCQVNIGGKEPQQIVCGATNHRQGDKVVASLPGAVLPGDFEIKKSKIRGVESLGMLCSETELGLLNDSSEGILILPADAPVGMPFADYRGLNDVIFELSVTPNRADCLSHFGLAREISALTNKKLKALKPTFKIGDFSTKKRIELNHVSELCTRYSGRLVRGVKVGPSPAWLRQRLESIGLNSINNVVDVTNYVMMELGQPLHAFDLRHLRGERVIIDLAKKGEKFKSLDGTEYTLAGDELTIRDAEGPVALAGVVGGLNSGVSDDTTDLFIESAHFVAASVRRTSRKLGIETDSSYRFSRGVDPQGVALAMERACELIVMVAGGEVSADYHDSFLVKSSTQPVKVRLKMVESRLGYSVEAAEFKAWMERLHCQVEVLKDNEYLVTPPSFRVDLHQEVDFIEEYARLHGYQHIKETLPVLGQAPQEDARDYAVESKLIKFISSQGLSQAVNYNFVGEEFLKSFLNKSWDHPGIGVEFSSDLVAIKNPLSEDINVMRPCLAVSLFKNLLYNYRYGRLTGRLFEVGRVFKKKNGEFNERARLGLMAWGQKETLWEKSTARPVIYDLKTTMENLLAHLKSSSWQWRAIENPPALFHPGQCAVLFYEGQNCGFIASLHPSIRSAHKIRADVALAEFDIETLMRGQPRLAKIKALSKFPVVERDFAFVLPEQTPAGEVLRYIQKIGGNDIKSVEIFDVYKGQNLPPDRRSVAFRVVIQSDKGTLSEEELKEFQSKIIRDVTQKFGAETR